MSSVTSCSLSPGHLINCVAYSLVHLATMGPKFAFILSPFHVGLHRHRVGKGPERIFAKLQPLLDSRDIAYRTTTIGPVDGFEGEIGRSFELLRRIAEETSQAIVSDEFPIVLAGNCHSSAGVVAGLAAAGIDLADLDIFWTDAHADAQVPDDNTNGYFDSMGTTMIAGLCWKYHMSTLVKHVPVPLSNVTYIGARDMEESEKLRIVQSDAHCIFGGQDDIDYASKLANHLQELPVTNRSLIHIDLDVLDPAVGHANDYPVPGGLSAQDLLNVMSLLVGRNPTSLTIASFDPDLKNGSDIVDLAVKAILRLVDALA